MSSSGSELGLSSFQTPENGHLQIWQRPKTFQGKYCLFPHLNLNFQAFIITSCEPHDRPAASAESDLNPVSPPFPPPLPFLRSIPHLGKMIRFPVTPQTRLEVGPELAQQDFQTFSSLGPHQLLMDDDELKCTFKLQNEDAVDGRMKPTGAFTAPGVEHSN